MLTVAGSGYSRCADLAITRWREDATRDAWGTYIFLRDVHSGDVWSAGYQPTGVEPDAYRATFFEDRAELYRRDGAITTTLEVLVSPQDDVELRRVAITNLGGQGREIEVTSYAEIVLAPPAADAAHPAFSSLFVQTEWIADLGALLATRRRRSPEEPSVWAAHIVAVEGQSGGGTQYETDRGRFLGRGRGIRTPMAVVDGRPLSNTVGSVLDPIFSLRRRVRLGPGESARLLFSTLVASSREEAVRLADECRDPASLRAHGHPGLDAGPGPVAPSRNRGGRGPPVPDPGQSNSLLGPGAPTLGGRAEAQRVGALGPLGPPDLR